MECIPTLGNKRINRPTSVNRSKQAAFWYRTRTRKLAPRGSNYIDHGLGIENEIMERYNPRVGRGRHPASLMQTFTKLAQEMTFVVHNKQPKHQSINCRSKPREGYVIDEFLCTLINHRRGRHVCMASPLGRIPACMRFTHSVGINGLTKLKKSA